MILEHNSENENYRSTPSPSPPDSTEPRSDTEAAAKVTGQEFPKLTLTVREKIFLTLTDPTFSMFAYCLSFYFDGLVALSMVLMCSETVPTWSRTLQQKTMWSISETILTMNFLVDFVLKVVTARPLLRYIVSRPTFTIDLLGLLPYFAERIVDLLRDDGNNSIKAFRVLRLLRFFRLSRIAYENFPYVRMFIQAIRRSKLAIAFLGMYVFGAGLFFATCIYYAETSECILDESKDVWFYRNEDDTGGSMGSDPCAIQSIFGAWWFTLVTMTTVGYGDINVISTWGRILTVWIMIGSLVFLALPSAIFAANLTEMYLERRLLKKIHTTPPASAYDRKQPGNVNDFNFNSMRKERPLTPSDETEMIQNLLTSVGTADDQIQSALSNLSNHLAFIHHQHQQLQTLLLEKNRHGG